MKAHKLILLISLFILIIEIALFVLLYHYGWLSTWYKMSSLIVGMIWLFLYPLAIYTCYYHIYKGDKKGNLFEKILYGFSSDKLSALIFIPLLVSPLFLFDYICLFKEDYRKYKWNIENEQ